MGKYDPPYTDEKLKELGILSVEKLKEYDMWKTRFFSAPGFWDVIANYKSKENIIGLEIGVCLGENIVRLMEKCPHILFMDGIDPYLGYKTGGIELSQELMDWQFDIATYNLCEYDNVHLHRMTSVEWSKHVLDETYDFIFIDGDHTYAAVIQDLNTWYPKLKVGGIFAGHDYDEGVVKSALEEFRSTKNITIPVLTCDNNVWYWIKD